MEVFQDYAYYYNMFYGDKDYAKEAAQINDLIQKYDRNQKVANILNMGCGTGRHDFVLANLGYHMHGIDLSEGMIEIAQAGICKTDDKPSFEVADVRFYEPKRRYDAVISLFHVMSYQNRNEDILKAFEGAAKALNKGGLFVFDTWYGPGVLSDLPTVRVKKVEDKENTLIRYASPIMHAEENVVDVCYNVLIVDKKTSVSKEISEVHHMRYFFKPEIELMLNQTGFDLVTCLDCNTLSKTDFNSWTAYFVAVRK